MSPALIDQSATSQLERIQAGKLTSSELTRAYLDRIGDKDDSVGAFLRVDAAAAMATAAEIDQRREAGEKVGRLAGLPVATKDILCSRTEKTTCGSRMLENFSPPYDATVIDRLRRADAVLIGRTNMDEFAMGGSTENSALGTTRNPWNLDCVPGGSSGGAAACVAASMAPLSIGTDTGGSIRQPASFCGVVGLKPTYGRVSRYGLVAFASSLDQVGPLSSCVEDAALLLEVIAGHDARDSTSAPVNVPAYSASVDKPLENLRLGVVDEHLGEGVDGDVASAVREAIKVYESLGAKIVDVSLPHSRYGIATYYIIAPSEASSNLARYDGVQYGYRTDEKAMYAELDEERQRVEAAGGDPEEVDSPLVRMFRRTRSEAFGPEVKRRIMLGTYVLSAGYYDAYYLKALKVRRLIRDDYDMALEQVNFILGPVSPTPAFRAGERADDPLAMYLGDLFTVTGNLAGIPGISVPCGFTQSSLPVGLQLQGRPFDEERLLRAAYMFQQATDWHQRRAPL